MENDTLKNYIMLKYQVKISKGIHGIKVLTYSRYRVYHRLDGPAEIWAGCHLCRWKYGRR